MRPLNRNVGILEMTSDWAIPGIGRRSQPKEGGGTTDDTDFTDEDGEKSRDLVLRLNPRVQRLSGRSTQA